MAVYPFTSTFYYSSYFKHGKCTRIVGVGGGTTSGNISLNIGLQAEFYREYGMVVNSPMQNEIINMLANDLDIPVVATVVSKKDDYVSKIQAVASILNVSAAKDTAFLVKSIRNTIGNKFQ